jgi:hypothetical protein
VKSKSEKRVVSEPVEGSNETETHVVKSELCAGVAVVGGAVAIGGAIVGSTAVTAIGVAAVVVGGTCYLLEDK